MGKTIIILLILSLFIISAGAQNYEYKYNPYTGKRDRTLSLNQSGENFTFSNVTTDNLLVINPPTPDRLSWHLQQHCPLFHLLN